ncbi:hypothetical protein Bpfe_009669 [Biomphalaria pfeifferi]|uniref:Uncharacterized protein n=1 Tax=Biomphalaria pfeifferi TaxID=112525 RepID=A0AAD8FDW6_BIOPF|nr:hypothetical protein Bpfe_009669 [Biomphalaria pfeifferi]
MRTDIKQEVSYTHKHDEADTPNPQVRRFRATGGTEEHTAAAEDPVVYHILNEVHLSTSWIMFYKVH